MDAIPALEDALSAARRELAREKKAHAATRELLEASGNQVITMSSAGRSFGDMWLNASPAHTDGKPRQDSSHKAVGGPE